ncbi:MAG: D-alanyl-D-alanine carboxypeptidase family protein [Romboutsia timonensis]|uniref:D-alanyl-D-alanine carboxypeptidase family protein n=1 Tax=Romboutsia timonensis TaxID=1776391 RepID=UPI002A74B26E|nr:D-alanyl-D-alanine carboxypeptidase family protein [Romboutsia timonensis]MDY2881529.1 D-alanyl-D-alanine carboxypeptidase family protein [Romboutsia timonensis]
MHKYKSKHVLGTTMSLLLVGCNLFPTYAMRVNEFENANIDIDSVAVIDQQSGDLLYSQNADKVRNIASVTKCMTLLLTLEAVDRGDISLDDIVEINEIPNTWGSEFGFKKGDKFTVYELLEMAMIISANDACVVLAGVVSGSVEQFVEDMNTKAAQLGLNDTKFFNPNGLPLGRSNNADGGNVSTARDIAYLVKFINDNYFSIVNKITSSKVLDLKGMDGARNNTNKLLFRNDASKGYVVDGFKTGFTNQAGYCLVTTSVHDNNTPDNKDDDFRTIGVSLGGVGYEHRFDEHSRMLKYISDKYVKTKLISKDEVIRTYNKYDNPKTEVKIVPQTDLNVLIYNGDTSMYKKTITVSDNIEYPIKKGDVLGKIEFINEKNPSMKYSVNLVSLSDVSDISFLEKLFKR